MPSTKGLLVTHFNCRASATGTVSSLAVYVGRGGTVYNLTDNMLFPLKAAVVRGTTKNFAVDAPIEFVVPASQSIGFDAFVNGTGLSSVSVICTYTGRWATL